MLSARTKGYTKLLPIVSKNNKINEFNLTKLQKSKIESYINLLIEWNKKFNLVGKSTLADPINSHVVDSIQISKLIKNKNSKIVDIGTGAGLPGIILSIYGYNRVSLVDSNLKKINFIKHVSKKLSLNNHIICSRIENLKNIKFDYVVSRALAKIDKLLSLASRISHKKTNLIFLKGEKITSEIFEAQNNWNFNFFINNSLSDKRGKIILINNFFKNNA